MNFRRQTIHTGQPAKRVMLVTGDIDRDCNDEIVIAGRIGAEGAYWLARDAVGQWQPRLIDNHYERLEAGGVLFDLDGDGRPELYFWNQRSKPYPCGVFSPNQLTEMNLQYSRPPPIPSQLLIANQHPPALRLYCT